MHRGHFDEAIRFWSQTLAIDPAMVLVRANLQAEQARAVMCKALEFNPSFSGRARFPRTNREVNTVPRCGPIGPRTLSWLHPHWMAIEVTVPPRHPECDPLSPRRDDHLLCSVVSLPAPTQGA